MKEIEKTPIEDWVQTLRQEKNACRALVELLEYLIQQWASSLKPKDHEVLEGIATVLGNIASSLEVVADSLVDPE